MYGSVDVLYRCYDVKVEEFIELFIELFDGILINMIITRRVLNYLGL